MIIQIVLIKVSIPCSVAAVLAAFNPRYTANIDVVVVCKVFPVLYLNWCEWVNMCARVCVCVSFLPVFDMTKGLFKLCYDLLCFVMLCFVVDVAQRPSFSNHLNANCV